MRLLEQFVRERRDLFVDPHVLFELYRGVRRGPGREAELHRIRRIGEEFRLLPFEREASRLAARMSGELEHQGAPIPDLDLFIAACAIVWGDGVVATRDVEHFRRLRPFGLRVLEA